MIFEKNGVELPKSRSHFHLCNKQILIKMFENEGFKNILCWSQFFAWNFQTQEDFDININRKGMKQLFDCVKDEEKSKLIKKEIREEYLTHIKNNEPVGLEVLFIIGEKF